MADRTDPDEALPPEEPLFVERGDGFKHPPRIRAYAFIGLIRAGTMLARDLDAELQETHRLSLHAYEVLLHLAVFSPDGTLRLSQLVAQAPLSQSRVSRLVADLETRGLVTRSPCPGDARGVDVAITEAGLALLRAAQETHLRGLDARFFSRLSWPEVVELARIAAKLLDDAPQPPVP